MWLIDTMTKSQKLLSQPYLKNRNMFVGAVDACIYQSLLLLSQSLYLYFCYYYHHYYYFSNYYNIIIIVSIVYSILRGGMVWEMLISSKKEPTFWLRCSIVLIALKVGLGSWWNGAMGFFGNFLVEHWFLGGNLKKISKKNTCH